MVFILIDDLGWRDLGCYGSQFYQTPNIDRLATEGLRFTSAYAAAPNCAPSRACLLTGMYTPRHGIYTVGSSERGNPSQRKIVPTPNTEDLDPKFQTLANALHGAGYVCASIGKWHLGDAPDTGPLQHGFDLNVGGNRAGNPKFYFSPYGNKDLPDGPKGEYLTDRLTDEALAFIHANKNRPFFLYLPHYAVHLPLGAKPELIAQFANKPPDGKQKNSVYAAMIASVDESVGRIMKELRDTGLEKNTLVVFTSDNGGVETVTDIRPLRGAKGWPYEGGIRVPLIIRWPGHIINPGQTCDTAVTGVDFLPTLTDLCGAKALPNQPADGRDLLPLLSGRADKPFPAGQALFWHLPVYLESYTAGNLWRCTPCSIIRKGDWKLIEFFEDRHIELYNLREDIGETRNLSASEPKKTEELLRELRAWQTQVHAPIPSLPNPDYDPAAKLPPANNPTHGE